MLNFLVTGIIVFVRYETPRRCFFNSCDSGLPYFERNYFSDVYLKVFFGFDIVLLIVLKYFYINIIKAFDVARYNQRATPGGFTLIVGNISGIKEGNRLSQYIETMVPGVAVKKVNFVYNISEFYHVMNKWMHIEKKLTLLETKGLNSSIIYKYYIRRRRKLKNYYNHLKKLINSPETFDKFFAGYAFVTFYYQKDATTVLDSLNYKVATFHCKRTKYSVGRANEPGDILWENFGLSKGRRILRRIVLFIISLIIIGGSFTAILAIKYLQDKIEIADDSIILYYIVNILISLVIVIVNAVLRLVLRAFNRWESRTTYTMQESELAFKISIAYFVNIAVVVVITSYIFRNNEIWNSNGMVAIILVFQFISIFSDALVELFNPIYLWKAYWKWHYLRKINKKGSNNRIIQYELNYAYEGIEFDIAERYYMIFKLISVVFFFQSVMPYLLLFGIVEIAITYWTHKYILVKRCRRPRDIDFMFSFKMTQIFDIMVFILALGFFTFEIIITSRPSVFSVVMLCITFLAWGVAAAASYSTIFKRKADVVEVSYDKLAKTFPTDYDRLNPITQREAVREWLASVFKKTYIAQSQPDVEGTGEAQEKEHIFGTLSRYITADNRLGSFSKQFVDIFGKENGEPKSRSSNDPEDGSAVKDVDIYKFAMDASLAQQNLMFQDIIREQERRRSSKSIGGNYLKQKTKRPSFVDDLYRARAHELNSRINEHNTSQFNDSNRILDTIPEEKHEMLVPRKYVPTSDRRKRTLSSDALEKRDCNKQATKDDQQLDANETINEESVNSNTAEEKELNENNNKMSGSQNKD